MKQIKMTAIVLALLLSVSSIAPAFAQESLPLGEVIAQQAEATVQAPVVEQVEPVVVEETANPASDDVAAVPEGTQMPVETAASEATATPEVPGTPEETAMPEATATPADTATPEATQTADSTTQEPTPTAQPIERSVEITMDIPTNLQMGDTVTLTATLIGYDNVNVALQWQYTKDGETWFDAQGEGCTTLTYAFTVSDETAGTGWRLGVTVL